MALPRRLRFIALGAVLGAALALVVWQGERTAIAQGRDAASVGFGQSHLLFFISLPWSLGVWALLVAVGTATGADGPAFLRPFFYAMPVVAGAGWGWLASLLGRRRTDRPPSRPAA